MQADTAIIVLDVGKTMSKLSLWTSAGTLLDRSSRPNERCTNDRFDVLDVSGVQRWLTATLKGFASQARVGHIIPVAHGAAIAAVRDGELCFPPLDYEGTIPAPIRAAYVSERDGFELTGSPLLAEGLNAALQLFRVEREAPGCLEGATLLPWAQYWSWFLSGEARSEVTSLGCHTDLWCPERGTFSPMAERLGWADKFAPIAFAGGVIGTIKPALAAETGLPADTRVHCGLHDSNAALIAARAFAEIGQEESTVLSTGTWFVAMRSTAEPFSAKSLPMGRDCLVNVDAWNKPVPSGRFMGGREIETLIGIDTRRVDIKPDQPALLAAVSGLLQKETMLQPTFAHGFGPFPNGRGRWVNMPDDWFARRAGACVYAALVADVSLDLIGSNGPVLVEGRFGEADVFVRTLAALRPHQTIYTSHAQNDVSFGALRLINSSLQPDGALQRVPPLEMDFTDYKQKWTRLAQQTEQPG